MLVQRDLATNRVSCIVIPEPPSHDVTDHVGVDTPIRPATTTWSHDYTNDLAATPKRLLSRRSQRLTGRPTMVARRCMTVPSWGVARGKEAGLDFSQAGYITRLSTLRDSLIDHEKVYFSQTLERLSPQSPADKHGPGRLRTSANVASRGESIAPAPPPSLRNTMLTTVEKFRLARPQRDPPEIPTLEGKKLIRHQQTEGDDNMGCEHPEHQAATGKGMSRHVKASSNSLKAIVQSNVDETVQANLRRLQQPTISIPNIGRKALHQHQQQQHQDRHHLPQYDNNQQQLTGAHGFEPKANALLSTSCDNFTLLNRRKGQIARRTNHPLALTNSTYPDSSDLVRSLTALPYSGRGKESCKCLTGERSDMAIATVSVANSCFNHDSKSSVSNISVDLDQREKNKRNINHSRGNDVIYCTNLSNADVPVRYGQAQQIIVPKENSARLTVGCRGESGGKGNTSAGLISILSERGGDGEERGKKDGGEVKREKSDLTRLPAVVSLTTYNTHTSIRLRNQQNDLPHSEPCDNSHNQIKGLDNSGRLGNGGKGHIKLDHGRVSRLREAPETFDSHRGEDEKRASHPSNRYRRQQPNVRYRRNSKSAHILGQETENDCETSHREKSQERGIRPRGEQDNIGEMGTNSDKQACGGSQQNVIESQENCTEDRSQGHHGHMEKNPRELENKECAVRENCDGLATSGIINGRRESGSSSLDMLSGKTRSGLEDMNSIDTTSPFVDECGNIRHKLHIVIDMPSVGYSAVSSENVHGSV